jgi:hypothetical protein
MGKWGGNATPAQLTADPPPGWIATCAGSVQLELSWGISERKRQIGSVRFSSNTIGLRNIRAEDQHESGSAGQFAQLGA